MLYPFILASAWASSNYPSTVESELGMDCAPQCTLCHASNSGGSGTVTAEFGMAMMDRGLAGGGQTDLVVSALAAMTSDGVDSDGDGTIDTDELSAGQNPNPGGADFCAGGTTPLTPSYGCFNSAQAPMSALGIFGAALAFGLVKRRR
jgi:hypothetical protein